MSSSPARMGKREVRKALLTAIKNGESSTVSSLVHDYPEMADAPNSHGNTPLGAAISANNLEIVKLLVQAGAAADHRNQGGSGLIDAAAWGGSKEIASYLVDNGCTLTLNHAAALGMYERVQDELANNPQKAMSGSGRGTPLHFAAHGNHVNVIELLLNHGADIRARNFHGHEPLVFAVESKSPEAVSFLLKHGADPNVLGGHSGAPVLHRAIISKSLAVTRTLLDAGADPNKPGVANKSALHEAVTAGKVELVQCVLDYDVDLEMRTKPTRLQPGNETALEYARRTKKAKIVCLLESKTVDA